jgi:hypothetical protein
MSADDNMKIVVQALTDAMTAQTKSLNVAMTASSENMKTQLEIQKGMMQQKEKDDAEYDAHIEALKKKNFDLKKKLSDLNEVLDTAVQLLNLTDYARNFVLRSANSIDFPPEYGFTLHKTGTLFRGLDPEVIKKIVKALADKELPKFNLTDIINKCPKPKRKKAEEVEQEPNKKPKEAEEAEEEEDEEAEEAEEEPKKDDTGLGINVVKVKLRGSDKEAEEEPKKDDVAGVDYTDFGDKES